MISNRILNITYINKFAIKSQSLNMFITSFETMHNSLKLWVFTSIRTPYLSILNTPNLDIDLSSFGSLEQNVSKAAEDIYIRLEIRVSGFIKSLSEQENFEKLDQTLIKYLSLLVSNNAYIPKEFFTLFEYSRINTENNELKGINEKEMQMILGVYIICKILCKDILIDQSFSQGTIFSEKIKRNYKMCSSIIYNSAIEYFRTNCPIKRNINNILTYSDSITVKTNANEQKRLLYDLNKNPEGPIDKSYLDACEKYSDKEILIEPVLKVSDQKLMARVISKIPKYNPDTEDQDIEVIKNLLIPDKDLVGFKKMAIKYKFTMSKLIVEFLDKVINVLEVNKEQI